MRPKRHWLALLSSVIGLLSLNLAAHAAGLQPVKPAAIPAGIDARLTTLLAQHTNAPVLINFWATWCEPCREEMPALHRLALRGQRSGLVVLTVAVADNEKRVAAFLADALPENAALPVLHDREQAISRAWGVRMLPATLLLDRRHRLVARSLGVLDWDQPELDRQLESLAK